MTYLEFHLLFIVPPVLAAAFLYYRQPPIDTPGMSAGTALWALCVIALAYTTPWDNYLVWRGVWKYGSERVIGTIGYVPIEEYVFFILQPLLAGYWFFLITRRADPPITSPPEIGETAAARWLGTGVYLAFAAAGVLMLFSAPTLYLGLILAWGGPVLALQWAYAGARYWQMRRVLFAGVAAPTLYLWIADRIAIGAGIWSISEEYTTGLHLFGLPIEEAAFFFVTDLLVVQGLILFIAPPGLRPISAAKS